jgi:hypothetical protein
LSDYDSSVMMESGDSEAGDMDEEKEDEEDERLKHDV